MRRPNEKPGATGKVATGLKSQSAGQPTNVTYPSWGDVGNIGREIISDALELAFEDHFVHAPKRLKDRFYAATTPTIAGDALVHLARVRVGKHLFEFDDGGRWAVVAPIFEAGETFPVDLAAFDIADDNVRRVYRGKGFAVGLPSALFDAHFHPNYRAQIHADVWAWLRCECTGILPVDWRLTTLALLQYQVGGMIADNDDQARKIESQLRTSLMPLKLFVKRERLAA